MSITNVRPIRLVVASSLWMATVTNLSLWRELNALNLLDGVGGFAFATALALMTAACLAALLSLFAWRWTLKPVITLFLVAAALGTYFMLSYHVVIDSTMMVNVLQTDLREASALFNGRMVAMVVALAGLPGWLVWRARAEYAGGPVQTLRNLGFALTALVIAAAVALASFQPLSSAMRNHKELRYLINPLNTVYALAHMIADPLRRDETQIEPVGRDAKLAATARRPPLLVLVLGETARSGNFGLNGYARATTPELEREKVASFRNARSCGTSTATSVPCMFSHLGRSRFEARAHNYETLLDVLQRAGLAVLWIDNQSGCKGTCDRVPSVNVSESNNPQLCAGGECHDGILIDGLADRLAALPAARRARGVVLVLHQMGSHGPAYHLRSPKAYKRFLPECMSNNLQDCSRSELLNAYDNSIVYTDHVLASTINWLKGQQTRYDTAMVYVSDHGESLGEKNLYLHGMPYSIAPDVQKHVPWISWLSPAFEQRNGIEMNCLRGRGDVPVSHDYFFHSVLGLLQVESAVYQRQLDIYAPCAAH